MPHVQVGAGGGVARKACWVHTGREKPGKEGKEEEAVQVPSVYCTLLRPCSSVHIAWREVGAMHTEGVARRARLGAQE